MEGSHPCKSCGKRALVTDDVTGCLVCSACGIVQDFDNYQHDFGGISGPTGTFVRTGTAGSGSVYSYKETKIYKAKDTIEHITRLLNFWPSKTNEVRVMVETITKGEYGQGDWFPVLVGACAYVLMRKENKSLPLAEVADKVGCDVYEVGRMVNRVVNFLELKLPEFDIVNTFERAMHTCFGAASVVAKDKIERMLKQGIFLLQCLVKWYLTTGRRPLPVVVAVLVFVAQLNEVDVRMEDLARELHAAIATSRLRYKELLQTLVKVAQILPWGKDITVKNILKNAPFVIQYMELKSMSNRGEKRKSLEHAGFDLDDLIGDCLSKEVEYGRDDYGRANDSQYFEIEDKSSSPKWTIDNLEKLKISHECLSMAYSELSNEVSTAKSVGESEKASRRKRRWIDLSECKEWWKGKSELSKKLFLKQILEKDVGFNDMPPSFVNGCLAYQRRREKIKAAKLRIDKIMHAPNEVSGEKDNPSNAECINIGKKRKKKMKVDVDWEDLIIETLLLHQVKEDDIEKGHYNTLMDLHVFKSMDM